MIWLKKFVIENLLVGSKWIKSIKEPKLFPNLVDY